MAFERIGEWLGVCGVGLARELLRGEWGVADVADCETARLRARLTQRDGERHKLTDRLAALKSEIASLRQREEALARDIEDNGGRRLQELEREIEHLGAERDPL